MVLWIHKGGIIVGACQKSNSDECCEIGSGYLVRTIFSFKDLGNTS